MFQTKNRTPLYLGILVAALVLAGCNGDPIGDKYVSFAKCLTSKQVTMYGAYWCPHCVNQKKLFGEKGTAELNYVECDPNGKGANPALCAKKGVQGFPTWEFPDGTKKSGELSLEELSQLSSCPLEKAPSVPPVTPPPATK